jgi:hypothetical protein
MAKGEKARNSTPKVGRSDSKAARGKKGAVGLLSASPSPSKAALGANQCMMWGERAESCLGLGLAVDFVFVLVVFLLFLFILKFLV